MRFSGAPIYSSRRSPVLARNVVATSQPLAAQAGLAALARGGNALDAALATAIALTVVEPTGNGLGSDAFCLLWDGERLHGLNASGRSPAAWTPERFAGRDAMPFRGVESVTVPGAVSAWVELSARFGKLPFETLFEPAIGYAERGFAVSPVIAALWAAGESLAEQPGFAHAYLPGGRAPRAGETFRHPELAATLRRIAETRGEAFYRGEIAERIASCLAEHGAALTADDLAAHRNDWVEPIGVAFGDWRLWEIPPNGQGIAALLALGALRRLGLEHLAPDDPRAIHLQIEAVKQGLALAERFVADPAAMTAVGTADLLAEAHLDALAARIDPERATDPKAVAPNSGGTVYLATADEAGMMVSYIQSNYAGFGSGVVVPGTGVSLQNRGAGFVLEDGHPNRVGPRKRPFHTIIPGFVTDADGREPGMSFGVMGGPMQAQGHVQVVLRTRLWGQDPQTAADAPRFREQSGRRVAVESAIPQATRDALAAMGHELGVETPDAAFGFGGAQAIARHGDGYAAGSDPRKDGGAVGF